mgnify:CR=1 FL=1
MLKGDLVSCRLQYGDEAMVKKGKAILKQTGAGIFSYVLFCLGGAYESYFRGADLNFTARIAGCVLFCVCLWTFICIIKKNMTRECILVFYICSFPLVLCCR